MSRKHHEHNDGNNFPVAPDETHEVHEENKTHEPTPLHTTPPEVKLDNPISGFVNNKDGYAPGYAGEIAVTFQAFPQIGLHVRFNDQQDLYVITKVNSNVGFWLDAPLRSDLHDKDVIVCQ